MKNGENPETCAAWTIICAMDSVSNQSIEKGVTMSPKQIHNLHVKIRDEKSTIAQSKMLPCSGERCRKNRMRSSTQFAPGSNLCFRCAKGAPSTNTSDCAESAQNGFDAAQGGVL